MTEIRFRESQIDVASMGPDIFEVEIQGTLEQGTLDADDHMQSPFKYCGIDFYVTSYVVTMNDYNLEKCITIRAKQLLTSNQIQQLHSNISKLTPNGISVFPPSKLRDKEKKKIPEECFSNPFYGLEV